MKFFHAYGKQSFLGCLLLFILLLSTIRLSAQERKRILFVGNSYTYQWSLPQTVEDMARKKGRDLFIQHSTAGGVNWGHHWRGERGLNTRQMIKEGKYDIVILQNHSLRTIEAPDSLHIYGEKFNQIIRQSGATPMLYMTWAREWNPLMIDPIAKEYEALGDKINALVVPVGRIWQQSRLLRPDLNLFAKDGSHQSPTGIYLAACAFYTALTGDSPKDLANRIFTEDLNGERVYLNIQTKEDAQFCQELTFKVMNDLID